MIANARPTPSPDDYEEMLNSLKAIGEKRTELNQQALIQFTPIVDDILRSGNRDIQVIEQTLDRLLDFCGSDAVLQLYRLLCRHYYFIDPAAAVYYVNAYRELWDSEPDTGTTNPQCGS